MLQTKNFTRISFLFSKFPVYQFSQPQKMFHPSEKVDTFTPSSLEEEYYTLPHPQYTPEELDKINIDHKEVATIGDRFAKLFVQSMRVGFDLMSGYSRVFPWQSKEITEEVWVNRVIFLETVAGVPGFVAGMHRHLMSLRYMKRDYGWIHTLLEEAENERVHLHTFMHLKKPTVLFRTGVIAAQFYYVGLFGVLYIFLPRVCHRIVGYLEEQAVLTYTKMIDEILKEGSPINHWQKMPASKHAMNYWGLKEDATLLDVVKAVRKDEEHHKVVNHMFADDYTQKKANPLPPRQ